MYTPVIADAWIEVVPDNDPEPSYLYQDEPDFSDRRAAYERGDFAFVGVRAVAEIRLDTEQGGYALAQKIETPGLWGIEDDSGEPYLREVGIEEVCELADMLASLGVRNASEVGSFVKDKALIYR